MEPLFLARDGPGPLLKGGDDRGFHQAPILFLELRQVSLDLVEFLSLQGLASAVAGEGEVAQELFEALNAVDIEVEQGLSVLIGVSAAIKIFVLDDRLEEGLRSVGDGAPAVVIVGVPGLLSLLIEPLELSAPLISAAAQPLVISGEDDLSDPVQEALDALYAWGAALAR